MTDQQNAALEPCPFCGGEARIEQRSQNQCWVECMNQDCRAMGKNCEGPQGASAAWNTRPAPAEDGLREFVESIVNAMGPYPDLNGHPIISAAYAALRAQGAPPMKKLTDKERLDWLAMASSLQIEEVMNEQEDLYANSGFNYGWRDALRDAIDAAIRAEKAAKKGAKL